MHFRSVRPFRAFGPPTHMHGATWAQKPKPLASIGEAYAQRDRPLTSGAWPRTVGDLSPTRLEHLFWRDGEPTFLKLYMVYWVSTSIVLDPSRAHTVWGFLGPT